MPVLNVCFLLWGTIKHGALIRKLVAFFCFFLTCRELLVCRKGCRRLVMYEQLVFEGIDGRPTIVYRSI